MEKTYRWMVLLGLLIGLVINAVATYQLKQEVHDWWVAGENYALQHDKDVATLQDAITASEVALKEQLAEHERLIMQLERMVNN